MNLEQLKEKLETKPLQIEFSDTMEVIDSMYEFNPVEFINGDTVNKENQNNGSCKLFAFAKLQNFSKGDALACFGKFYREDVLGNPDGDDHQNIRNFIKYGWDGIEFKGEALKLK